MARPRIYEEDRVVTAVRLPQTLHLWLHSEAKARHSSVNALVVQAVTEFLDQPGAEQPGPAETPAETPAP